MAGTRAGRRPGRRPGSGIREPPVPEFYPLLRTSGSGLTRLRNTRDLRFGPYYTSEYENLRFRSFKNSEYEDCRFRSVHTSEWKPPVPIRPYFWMKTAGSFFVLLDKRSSGSMIWRGWGIKWPPVLLVFLKASKNRKFSGKNHERTSGSFCGWVIYLIFGGKTFQNRSGSKFDFWENIWNPWL